MITMFDAIDLSVIPTDAQFVAGYVGGFWQTFPLLKGLFPNATTLSIAISADEDAECLDVEPFDAAVTDVGPWLKRQMARNVYRPVIYASVSSMNPVLMQLQSHGIARQDVRLWSAHYLQGEHICGPKSCGQVHIDMDGTQWTSDFNGKSLDQSILLDNFFDSAPPIVKPVTPEMQLPPTLQLGYTDTGKTVHFVVRAQAILNSVFGEKLTVDGNYGPETQAAVKRLQAKYTLVIDGVVGPKTWTVLYLG